VSIGVSKELSKISVKEEVTEGTYVPPAATTDFIQPIEGGYSLNGSKELKERTILTAGYTQARPRVGQRSVEFQINVEAKGSGVEGGVTDYDLLLKNMLGAKNTLASRITSGSSHSTTVINLSSTTGLVVGDIICVLEDDAHHISPIVTVTTDTSITLLVAGANAFSNSVEIAKFVAYKPSNTPSDFKPLSVSLYHGNEILEQGTGCRPETFSLEGFETGGIANFNFSGSGIDFDRTNAAAPYTPDYDDEVPPLILSSCVYIDGVDVQLNSFSFSMEHPNGFIASTCSESGRISGRKVGKRKISGSINPYLDDTSVANFTKFKANTGFSLFAFAANPSSTAGEYDLGSIWAVYLPNCVASSNTVGDLEGVLTEEIKFTADGGSSGELSEMTLAFI
jgi:CBS domain-containing protein